MEINFSPYNLFALCGAFVAALSQILLKKSANKKHKSFVEEYLNLNVIVGYLMMVGSTVLGLIAYSKVDYMNVPIMESTGYIFVLILGRLVFKERITPRMVVGTAIIMVGIIIYYLV